MPSKMEEKFRKELDDIHDLAVALQKDNPDLGWEASQDEAYKIMFGEKKKSS